MIIDRKKLKGGISLIGFFSLAFGSMIGVGWVTGIGNWFSSAGPMGAIIAFGLAGIFMALIGLCYAEVTSMIPVAGGEVAYAYKAFGVSKSFIIGWFLAFGYLSVSAFEAISVGKVLGYLVPGLDIFPLYSVGGDQVFASHLLLALVFTGIITAVNYYGPKYAVRVQIWLTYLFLTAVLLFVGAGLIFGDWSNLSPMFAHTDFIDSSAGIISVFITAPFWFVGFDTIPQAAEEAGAGIAAKNLGRIIVVSILASAVFYVLLILSTSLASPWESTIQGTLPAAAAFDHLFSNAWLPDIILIAALLGLFTSWNGFFLAGSRVLFALGRGRLISKTFGKVDEKYSTPSVAILFTGGFTLLSSFLGRGAMVAFVDVGSLCIAMAFLGVSLSFLKLRKDYPNLERPYQVKHPKLVGYIAAAGSVFILGALLIPASPLSLVWPLEWGIFGGITLLAIIFWYSGKKERDSLPEEDRKYLILEKY